MLLFYQIYFYQNNHQIINEPENNDEIEEQKRKERIRKKEIAHQFQMERALEGMQLLFFQAEERSLNRDSKDSKSKEYTS